MKTDDLIRALAADEQRQPALGATLIRGLVPAVLLALLAVWLGLGFRADLLPSLAVPSSVARIVLMLILGILATRLALALARPEGRPGLWPLTGVLLVALGLFVWAFATTPAEGRMPALVGTTMVYCVTIIPALSILPVASVLWALHQGATTAPAKAGFVAGLAGSGFAAATYAMHCPESSPLFYVTWYGVAILSVTLVSTLVGARVLRW